MIGHFGLWHLHGQGRNFTNNPWQNALEDYPVSVMFYAETPRTTASRFEPVEYPDETMSFHAVFSRGMVRLGGMFDVAVSRFVMS